MTIKVEIYTWQDCPHCSKAKNILTEKRLSFTEYSIDGDEMAHDAMSERANGQTTVPQIFINDVHIGGCSNLEELNSTRQLEKMLTTVADQ